MRTEEIEIKIIKISDDRLKPDEGVVKELMTSISKIGLINPITVCRPANQMGVHLVAGRNRLEAHKRLKLKTILARVEHGDTPAVRQWRELAEIDENLIRRDLSSALRAKLLGQRKRIYETLHPETALIGQARAKAKVGRHDAHEPFTADTAKKTGVDRSTVTRNVQQERVIGAKALDKIAGTSLDKEVELRALVKMDKDERAELVERAARGEKVTARVTESVPGFTKLDAAWKSASALARKKFVKSRHAELAEIIG